MGLLDWINPISSAVGAVTGLGSLLDNVTGGAEHRAKEMAKYQADLNEQAAENSYQRQLDMWNKQNEYDLPVNQIARYQAAGINPNATFGNVSANAATPAKTPETAAPDIASAQMAQYQRSALMLQQSRQMAETRLINAQADNVESQTDLNAEELKWLPKLRYTQVNLQDAQAIKTDKERQYYSKQITLADEQINEIKANIDKIRADIVNVNQDSLNKWQQYFQNDQSFEKLLKNLDMDIKVKGAQVSHLRAMCALIFAQVTGQELSNSNQRQINAFGAKTFNDKVLQYRFQTQLFGFNTEVQKLQMPALRKIGGTNVWLNTANNAASVVRNMIGISGDFLDNAKKPMSFGTDFLNGVSSAGGKIVP